jgi:diphthamide synthase (EF-2-diphthine--ammonia ligase)
MNTTALARTFISDGFRAVVVCVDSTQLDASFSGRAFDASLLAELPRTVDPCGENGEFHTFVYDGPMFRERIALSTGETVVREERFVYTDLIQRASADDPVISA